MNFLSGTMTEDIVLYSGTYKLDSNYNVSTYTLTFDLGSGNIVCTTDDGNQSIIVNSWGVINTINYDNGYKLYFTSRNDDLKGDIRSGSTGSPVSEDQCVPYVRVTSTGVIVDIEQCEVWYSAINMSGVFSWGDQPLGATTNDVTLKNIKLKYCKIPSIDSTDEPVFIGMYRRTGIGTVTTDNILIDDTNEITSSGVNTHCIKFARPTTWNMNNVAIYPTGSYYAGLTVKSSTSGTHTCNWNNIYIKYPGDGPTGSCPIYVSISAGGTLNLNIKRFLIDGNNKSRSGINLGYADGVANINISNSVFINNNCGIDSHTSSGDFNLIEGANIFYNNTIDVDTGLYGSGSFVANPDFRILPMHCITDIDNIFPDGLAIGNGNLWNAGSGTFDNLGIDENHYSSTGYKSLGTDYITPGISYHLSRFFERKNFPKLFINKLMKK